MDKAVAYLNGNWVSAAQLCVPVADLGFTLGATVTERLRTFRGQVFRLEEHLARLRGSLTIIGLDSEAIAAEIAQAVPEFLSRNRARIDPNDDWSIVAFVTPGLPGNQQQTVCVHGFPLPFRAWAAQFDVGVPTVISAYRQVPTNCWPAELKCRSRMHYYLADREAAMRKPGARAIVLDQDGYIAEGTTANVIAYRKQEGLISPPHDHILVGVSLGVVTALAAELSLPFVARKLTADELRSADEVMFASTSICLLPVVECDGMPIGDGKPGPVYRKLLNAWGGLVGVDVAEQARRFANRA